MKSQKDPLRFPQKLIFNSHSELQSYLDSNTNIHFQDLYKLQWLEWRTLQDFTINEGVDDFNEEFESIGPLEGTFFFYPWRNVLVRILVQSRYIEVVTNRNKYKITAEEQELLSHKRIGIVGLSVGRTVSTTVAMEKLCGELRVADFDVLDLSNLNRIKAPIFDLGELKTYSLAREISEFDPYFKLNCFDEGLTFENLDEFFTKNGKLDLIIDECDHLGMKVLIRKKARELGIPVLMDTSDRGMIDIERYDVEPDRKYFHGRLGSFDPPYDWKISPIEMKEFFGKILDLEQISKRGQYSLTEIGKSISTWPQLASAVVAGGGVCSEITRRILLGENVPSGRFFIDTETLIPNEF